jgi:diguanylate cyclase (GGDEF)-like protein/PAS domain S-box-containing protein
MKEKIEDYAKILDTSYDGVYFVDKDRKILYWNKEAEKISGYGEKEVVNYHCFDNILNHVDEEGVCLCTTACPLSKTMSDGIRREAKVYLHHKKGHRVAVTIRTVPLIVNGEIVGAFEFFVHNNDNLPMSKIDELTYLALHDQLTGIPNRRYIDSTLKNFIRQYNDLSLSFSVMMIDIDHFKLINDTYGHDMGDKVLKMVATTLSDIFTEPTFIGRWGGEEFMVISACHSPHELEEIANHAITLVNNSSFVDHGNNISVTISIGITIAQKDDDEEAITRRADQGMYESKAQGRNRFTFIK